MVDLHGTFITHIAAIGSKIDLRVTGTDPDKKASVR